MDEEGGEIEIDDRDHFIEEESSYDVAFDPVSPPGLGRGAGRYGASRWRQAQQFLDDLTDYRVERQGVKKEEFLEKMEKWAFEGKRIQKSGSSFRFKPLSWDE